MTDKTNENISVHFTCSHHLVHVLVQIKSFLYSFSF